MEVRHPGAAGRDPCRRWGLAVAPQAFGDTRFTPLGVGIATVGVGSPVATTVTADFGG